MNPPVMPVGGSVTLGQRTSQTQRDLGDAGDSFHGSRLEIGLCVGRTLLAKPAAPNDALAASAYLVNGKLQATYITVTAGQ